MNDKITIDRAGVQQALDALVHIDRVDHTRDFLHGHEVELIERVITKLREELRAALAAPQPAGCCFPTCKSESYQNELAEQLNQEFFTGTPLPAQPADIPKIGCINHDCDKCKAVHQPGALVAAHEREQCALECEDYASSTSTPGSLAWSIARDCAAVIRARGKP